MQKQQDKHRAGVRDSKAHRAVTPNKNLIVHPYIHGLWRDENIVAVL